MLIPSSSRGRPRRDPLIQGRSRFSSWFNGHSVISDDRSRSSRHAPKTWRTRGHSTSPYEPADLVNISGIRSPSSTRSIIDPVSSPNVGSGPASPSVLNRRNGEETASISGTRCGEERTIGIESGTRTRTRLALSRTKRKPTPNTQRRQCFPGFKNRKVKRKAIGCLVSGGLLAIILTTYLALAISSSGHGETFHAIFIMLTLIVTIIFCHYLIRLCMLVMRPKGYNSSAELVEQSQAGFVARPREPIRIILARDEELGLYEHNMVEEDKDIAVPPPPPAYGLWRCSVRADPNLIHWQRVEHPAILEEAPSLLPDRGSLARPPSYRSEHRPREPVPPARPPPVMVRDSWSEYSASMGAEPHSPAYNGVAGVVR